MRYKKAVMTVKEIMWNGFSGIEFEFDTRPAYLIKPGCGHHPRGPENPAVIADFFEKYAK